MTTKRIPRGTWLYREDPATPWGFSSCDKMTITGLTRNGPAERALLVKGSTIVAAAMLPRSVQPSFRHLVMEGAAIQEVLNDKEARAIAVRFRAPTLHTPAEIHFMDNRYKVAYSKAINDKKRDVVGHESFYKALFKYDAGPARKNIASDYARHLEKKHFTAASTSTAAGLPHIADIATPDSLRNLDGLRADIEAASELAALLQGQAAKIRAVTRSAQDAVAAVAKIAEAAEENSSGCAADTNVYYV